MPPEVRRVLLDPLRAVDAGTAMGEREGGEEKMIDWKACIVLAQPFSRRDIYVWVAYQKEKPYLPVAIDATTQELAGRIGVTTATVTTGWRQYRLGKVKRTRYHRVKVGIDHENI